MALEPGENPNRTLTWKALAFLSHIKRRTNDDLSPALVSKFRSSLELLNSVHAVFFNMINMVIICRPAKFNQRLYLLTTGLFISLVLSWVLWGTK